MEFCQIADELTQTQGKVEATKDTVRELNEKLEPVEVGLSWCYIVCWVFTLQETFLLFVVFRTRFMLHVSCFMSRRIKEVVQKRTNWSNEKGN